MKTRAELTLEFINNSIAKGLTIYLCTAYRTTVIKPATIEKFKKSGYELFTIDSAGDLRMQSGKNTVVICCKNVSLITIKAA